MRNGKHQRWQNAALSECHGKVVMDGFVESNTCAASWKASWKAIPVERRGNAVTECVTESMTQAVSRKKRHGKRRGRCDVMIVNSLVWGKK